MNITTYFKARLKGKRQLSRGKDASRSLPVSPSSFALLLSLAFAPSLLTSCDDYLDKLPDNRIEATTEDNIKGLIVSAYPDTHYAAIAELMSDNTDENTGSNYSDYGLLQTEASEWKDVTYENYDSPFMLWNSCYHAIACANEALEAMDKLGNPENLRASRGEALLCRAYNHWVLVNIFSKNYSPKTSTTDLGIPYVKTVEHSVNPHYDRGTVAEVYQNIAADLNEGLPLLRDAFYSVRAYHFTRQAADAFAARFWLFYVQPDGSNYDKVIQYARDALTDNPLSMLKDWKTIGRLTPDNNVRANKFIDADDPANLLLYTTSSLWVRMYGPYILGTRHTHNNLIAHFETNQASDHRTPEHYYTLWKDYSHLNYKIYQYSEIPKVMMDKFGEYFEYQDRINGIGEAHEMFPALLADECMLNMVEAYVMKKDYDNALSNFNIWLHNFTDMTNDVTLKDIEDVYGDYHAPKNLSDSLNNVYTGMKYYTPKNPTPKKRLHPDFTVEPGDQEAFIQCLLHCRRIMTLHEGLRWFDIKRYGLVIYRRSVREEYPRFYVNVTDSMTVDDPRRAVQLPQSVIKAGMQANPR